MNRSLLSHRWQHIETTPTTNPYRRVILFNSHAVPILLTHHDPSTDLTHVHSTEQSTHLPMRDCHRKFHLYLLYASRPLNTSFNYSILIHILDIDKFTFTHRSTWHIPMLFPFLPVYRLVLQLDIPSTAKVGLPDIAVYRWYAHAQLMLSVRALTSMSPRASSFLP